MKPKTGDRVSVNQTIPFTGWKIRFERKVIGYPNHVYLTNARFKVNSLGPHITGEYIAKFPHGIRAQPWTQVELKDNQWRLLIPGFEDFHLTGALYVACQGESIAIFEPAVHAN